MKRIIFLSFFALVSTQLFSSVSENKHSWFSSLSSGYVFKKDCQFKDVYGHGVVNILTGDLRYYPWEVWGIGGKLSYWRAKGHTSFLNQRSILQEMPVTLYVCGTKTFKCDLQLYASLGGGYLWVKEKSYLGHVHLNRGIGEVEVGLQYPIWRRINLVTAFRYLFPPQSQADTRVDVGGFDLRAGLGYSF